MILFFLLLTMLTLSSPLRYLPFYNPDLISFAYLILILLTPDKKKRYFIYLYASLFQELIANTSWGIFFLINGIIYIIFEKILSFIRPAFFLMIFLAFSFLIFLEITKLVLTQFQFNSTMMIYVGMQLFYFTIVTLLFSPLIRKYANQRI